MKIRKGKIVNVTEKDGITPKDNVTHRLLREIEFVEDEVVIGRPFLMYYNNRFLVSRTSKVEKRVQTKDLLEIHTENSVYFIELEEAGDDYTWRV